MQLKEIIVVTWTLMMRLLLSTWKGFLRLREKIGTGSMTTCGTALSSGIDGVISISLDNVEHPMSCTKEISHDGTLKIPTHTTGTLSRTSNELLQVTNTLRPEDISWHTYQENSIYDINLIFTTWGVDVRVKKTKQFLPEK